ncbi:TLR adapter interacting with SLC15A4 on the lysosome-like [Pyxicephalus adspersus]|uniref:TLR adapter interacting with SLC15A4 on the lysosome-like n=1 Tax=Pyxicephalus adspersus TaxID=30357 RepID=UPI003B5C27AE
MLSEAFLCTVMYGKVMEDESQQDKAQKKKVSLRRPHGQRAEERHSFRAAICGGDTCSCREEGCHHERGSLASSSQAMAIPSRDLPPSGSLDLYTSWSSMYASIYKNYPDLHIGGDHILNKKDSGCVLECEDGPVLLSVDIDSSSPPNDLPRGPPEKGVIHSEDSNILPPAPFSNSVLNVVLEKKMQELYKQCYEETMVTNASPNPGWPNVLMVNLNQMSLMVSQEQNIDQAKAREAIMQYLCSATSGGSSEFITPVLLISNQDNMKKSITLSKNSAHRKSCSAHNKK